MAHRSYALSDAKIGRDRSERSPYPRMSWVRIGPTERPDHRQAVIGHGPRPIFVLFFLLRERKSNVNGSGDVGAMITDALPAAPA